MDTLSSPCILAFDAGGTKTNGALVSLDGTLLRFHQGADGNYQNLGIDETNLRFQSWIAELIRNPDEKQHICSTVYGLSGLDRPKDLEHLNAILKPISPCSPLLLNDTDLILRAGTKDGVGIAVVSGTGSNCMGVNSLGERRSIGGLGAEFGDGGGGMDLATSALQAAFRGQDGRGKPTQLTQEIIHTFQLHRLDDVVDYWIDFGCSLDHGQSTKNHSDLDSESFLARLTPLLFGCAHQGDQVAQDLLIKAGQELALSVVLLAQKLGFSQDQSFPVVMGGSVFQKGDPSSFFHQSFLKSIHKKYPLAMPHLLQAPPLLGAILLGFDQALKDHLISSIPESILNRLKSQLNTKLT